MLTWMLLACITSPADAVVAVARAQVQVADDAPELQDTKPNTPAPVRTDLQTSQPTSPLVEKPYSTGGGFLSFPDVREPRGFMPAQLVIKGWSRGCPACVRLHSDAHRMLEPNGWTVGHDEDSQVRIVEDDTLQQAPLIILLRNGVEVSRWIGYQDVGMLSNRLLEAWNEGHKSQQASAESFGKFSVRAKDKIQTAIRLANQYVGTGSKVVAIWDRSGQAAIPLLAKKTWPLRSICGDNGHFQIDLPRPPVRSIGIGYRIEGAGQGARIDGFAQVVVHAGVEA